MEEFVVYPKRRRMILLCFGSLIFVLLGVLLYAIADLETGNAILGTKAFGILCIAFFGLCFLHYAKVIFKRKPAIVISKQGIIDNSSFISHGRIAWEEIADLSVVHFGGQDYLGIYTYDPDLIIRRTSGIKKWLNWMNKELLDTQVNIPIKALDCPLEELVDVIYSRWQKATKYIVLHKSS